jgi:hypothetical protein
LPLGRLRRGPRFFPGGRPPGAPRCSARLRLCLTPAGLASRPFGARALRLALPGSRPALRAHASCLAIPVPRGSRPAPPCSRPAGLASRASGLTPRPSGLASRASGLAFRPSGLASRAPGSPSAPPGFAPRLRVRGTARWLAFGALPRSRVAAPVFALGCRRSDRRPPDCRPAGSSAACASCPDCPLTTPYLRPALLSPAPGSVVVGCCFCSAHPNGPRHSGLSAWVTVRLGGRGWGLVGVGRWSWGGGGR